MSLVRWPAPLVSLRAGLTRPAVVSSGRAAGLHWFSSSATSLSPRWSARVGPLVSTGSARAPLASLRAGQLGSRHWSLSALVQLGPRHCVHLLHDPRCVHLLHDSVPWSRPKVSCPAGLVAGSPCPDSLPPLFFSAAQSPARANSTGIRSLSSVPHLWSSSFDCPASQVKRRPSASSRTHSDGPVSQTCLLPTLKGES